MNTFRNQLEPQSLVDAFLKHPPATFQLHTECGDHFFSTNFDLLTTLEAPLRQRLLGSPGYRHWSKWLQRPTGFLGTTVTEYSLLPQEQTVSQVIEGIATAMQTQDLTIIKDLPINSPLLSAEDNQYSQQLIEYATQHGFLSVEGQALAYVPIDFVDQADYLSRLSKSRRKNLKRKLKSLQQLEIEVVATGDHRFQDAEFRAELYALYLEVYQQSEIHFDLLTAGFFDQILQDQQAQGRIFFYRYQQQLVGFNICYIHQNNLVDKYIGFNYDLALQFNLYFVSWFVNLDYAKQQQLNFYIAGWTDPEVKSQLGAQFTFTRHLVWIKQAVLRYVLAKFKHKFESDAHWHQQKVE